MRIQLLLTLLILSSLGAIIAITYVHIVENQNQTDSDSLPRVLYQKILRNSEGQLISYVEGIEFKRMSQEFLDMYMDSKQILNQTSIVTQDGKQYEVFNLKLGTAEFKRDFSIAMYDVSLKKLGLSDDGDTHVDWTPLPKKLLINHNAFQIKPGDVGYGYLTIIRPVP